MIPSLTIIIPAYNSEKTLAEALDSIAKQEMPGAESIGRRSEKTGDRRQESENGREPSALSPLPYAFSLSEVEILVVDDASTDGTVSVVEEWVRSHPEWQGRIQVLHHPQNQGPAASRNQGLRLARSEWIAFLDADDIWLPEKLATQLQCVREHPEMVLWCGEVVIIARIHSTGGSTDGRSENQAHRLRSLTVNDFITNNPVATSTVLVRKSAVDQVGGFDESLRGPEDYDLWLRMIVRYPMARIEVALSEYRVQFASLSMDDRRFVPQVLKVLNKAFGPGGVLVDRTELRRVMKGSQYWSASWMALHRGDRWTAIRYWIKAYGLHLMGTEGLRRAWWHSLARFLVGAKGVKG
jgi:glycosyltransferase involved in cell wall biosynthesis